MPFSFRNGPRARDLAVLLAVALLLSACSEPQGEDQQPPPPVRFTTVEPVDLTIEEEYAGRVRGSREVEVRSRVEGIVLERLYNEGQLISEGDDLFLIDPRRYEIAVQQAEAEVANARATYNQAEREWRRISGLYEQNAVSERDRDQAQSALELAEAGVALARAGLASAQLNLDWTRVTAPISGVTGLETVSEGSLISTGALLTTITQTDPVHVRFALPERDAAMQQRARRAMRGRGENTEQTARLELPDDSEYASPGRVDFTDATIDPRTGSVSARAVFPNTDGELVPGQFVRIRMTTRSFEQVYSVPRQAVAQGADGAQLFIVGDDDAVSARSVELGPTRGESRLVLSGLESGERVVVSGLNNLRDGMTVEAQPVEANPESDDAQGGA
ncbi:efflux RND transporter periplasmic adaptor subunit [Wenzhouxiangella sp. EGI_FJ10305]|uniref:efflux RND transporter periplasmic adaptor subunit n=1 Tax=Wenzhouxiangella sp. EGI_FJ10305 TaxID=3243768 RepID=UPI0035DF7F9F